MSKQPMVEELQGFALLELDLNKDVSSFVFPSLGATDQQQDKEKQEKQKVAQAISGSQLHEETLQRRCGLQDLDPDLLEEPQFRFGRFQRSWHYWLVFPVPPVSADLGLSDAELAAQSTGDGRPLVRASCLAVVTSLQSFNPEKYEALLLFWSRLYLQVRSPLPVLQSYLSILTNGAVRTKLGSWSNAEWDPRRALVGELRNLLAFWGQEAVLLWMAVLLKKRMFVFCEDADQLLRFVRALPCLAWHRQDWSILYPLQKLEPQELKDLQQSQYYIAGFTEAGADREKDLYDIYFDLTNKTYQINKAAQPDFKVSKYHQQTAEKFVTAASATDDSGEPISDQRVIRAVHGLTKELLQRLESLRGPAGEDGSPTAVSLEHLKSQQLPSNLIGFLHGVAGAEGMA